MRGAASGWTDACATWGAALRIDHPTSIFFGSRCCAESTSTPPRPNRRVRRAILRAALLNSSVGSTDGLLLRSRARRRRLTPRSCDVPRPHSCDDAPARGQPSSRFRAALRRRDPRNHRQNMEAALLALLLAAARAANTSDVALVLRGLSSPRRYERFDGATVTSANWRATHCELRRRLIDPFGADAFLHTWAGDEAAAVVAARAPARSHRRRDQVRARERVAMWGFRGRGRVATRGYSADGPRRRRDVDIPWRRESRRDVARGPHPRSGERRGHFADGSRRRRGRDVDIPWRTSVDVSAETSFDGTSSGLPQVRAGGVSRGGAGGLPAALRPFNHGGSVRRARRPRGVTSAG